MAKKNKFPSAEAMAMHDISQECIEKAKEIQSEPIRQRYNSYPGIWLDTVSQIIGACFISAKRLKTKKNRFLNRKLGIGLDNKKNRRYAKKEK